MLSGAMVILFVNVAVGMLFAAAYLIVGLAYRGQRRALFFGACYLVGNMAPVADLLASFLGHHRLLDWVGYVCFLAGLDAMSLSFAYFHHRPMPWKSFLGILCFGIATRATIAGWPYSTFAYGFAYQLPLTLACVLGTVVVLRIAKQRFLYLLLASVFGLTAAHFLFKPFLLVRFGGTSLAMYTKTIYALLSQASTGICLFGCAIVLLIVVSNQALSDSQRISETDPLSGILNRRGYDRRVIAILAGEVAQPVAICAAIFDIDHFKRINDSHGHAMGDRVIAAFARVLQQHMPPDAVLGRIGGEEFAALLLGHDVEAARTYAEKARSGFSLEMQQHLACTVSCGLTAVQPREEVFHVMQRADRALYRAKEQGRDQVVTA